MTKRMNLLLIRHATNDWVGERLAGWTPEVHLNQEGRAQAASLARRLVDVPLAAIYSSPLERTLETAQPLAEAHGLTVQVCEGVGETRYGQWTGRKLEDLKDEIAPGGGLVVELYGVLIIPKLVDNARAFYEAFYDLARY